MSTPQTNIESIIIALIQTQAPFASPSTIPVVPGSTRTDLVTQGDRVTVTADKRVAAVLGRAPTIKGKVLQYMVDVRIIATTLSVTDLDAWDMAIETALNTAPAGVITLATTLFPNGCEVGDIQDTERNGDNAEQFTRGKTIPVWILP